MERGMTWALPAVVVALTVGILAGADSARTPGVDPPVATEAAAASPRGNGAPLSTQQTPRRLRLAVFERAYSECASTDPALLAAKYKSADRTPRDVATVVGRAWASYFRAGFDAVRDGREGCLLGQRERST